MAKGQAEVPSAAFAKRAGRMIPATVKALTVGVQTPVASLTGPAFEKAEESDVQRVLKVLALQEYVETVVVDGVIVSAALTPSGAALQATLPEGMR